MALIFGLSSISTPPSLPGGSDKGVHVILYAGLGVLMLRAIAGGLLRRVSWRALILAVVLAAAYGVTDEIHQRFVPGRSYDVADMAADAVGASAAGIAITLWSRMRHVL